MNIREGDAVRVIRKGDRNEGDLGVVDVAAALGNCRVLIGTDEYRWFWPHDIEPVLA
jgi:hypothetical protein